ncbi:ATP-binding protein [Micromonospora maritima]|uniref:ATP-binding protein n=1 Tax=Micromonospora maritima TaxID=986711 RepID=A0ABW7ZRI6_9ACTN
MTIRTCVVVGIEGTYAAGKSTLVHALTAHYRARGVLVACTPEPARTSPFIEETVIHGKGAFDLTTEVDLFGAQLSTTLRAARHHDLLICDKTAINVLAYARLVLAAPPGSHEAAVLQAMAVFCRAWAPSTYDAVFFLPDAYTDPADPMRAKVAHLQDETATAVRAACAEAGVALHDVPPGLDLAERVAHLARRVDGLLNLTGGSLGPRDPGAHAPR